MKCSLLTLFPEMFETLKNEGVVARAIKQNILNLSTIQLRDFSHNARKDVDDHPAGGGDGMVIRADVAQKALDSIREPNSIVILTTPRGKVFQNQTAKLLSQKKNLIFLCGRYAGFDERFIEKNVDMQLSIGDFVLSGGELAAMCMIDSIARFLPGTLGNEQSSGQDSFEDGLLEAPCYTKPSSFENRNIPEVLLSGDHEKIKKYRRKEQLKITAQMRPDLIHLLWDKLSRQEKTLIEKIWKEL